MPAEGFQPQVTSEFRGLITLPANPLLVPAPYAVAAQNVQFGKGGARTRPGLTTQATFNNPSLTVLSIKEYVTLDVGQRRVLAMTSDGQYWKEPGTYTFTSISAALVEASVAAQVKMASSTAFGREYIGTTRFETTTWPGIGGYNVPQCYDDSNLYPVAPSGPGSAPTIADGAASGDVNQISAGAHSWRVAFRTVHGYITPPGPAVAFTHAGSKVATITNIPIGPDYVVGRVLCVTPASNPSDYFYIPNSTMDIRDNTSTSATVQFLDTALIASAEISVRANPTGDLMNLSNLGQQSGSFRYHDRVAWFGERQTLHLIGDVGFLNMAFDGGYTANVPNGWTEKVAGEASSALTRLSSGFMNGMPLKITGNGTNMKGVLQNNGTMPVPWPSGKQINCRARLKRTSAGAASGVFLVYLCDSTLGNTTLPASYGVVQMSSLSTTEWRWIDFAIITAAANTPGTGWTLRIATGGTESGTTALPNNDTVLIDRLEVYDTAENNNPSLIRWSRAEQPDAYDDLYGIMTVGANDGQAITGGFVLGENFFVTKQRAIYAIRDDGANEPSAWSISVASTAKGAPSQSAIGIGDKWAVIASRSGFHLFSGSSLANLSEEIRTTWRRINWRYDWKISVSVDTERKRITVSVPLDGATECTNTLALEYFEEDPSGRREWNIWNLSSGKAITSTTQSERSDGTRHVLYGTNHTSGIVANLDDAVYADFTTDAIVSYYQLAFFGPAGSRGLWGYLTANCQGSGIMSVTGYLSDNTNTVTSSNRGAPNITLQAVFPWRVEWTVDATDDKISWRFGTSGVGDWFAMNEFTQYVKAKPWSPQRGLRGA